MLVYVFQQANQPNIFFPRLKNDVMYSLKKKRNKHVYNNVRADWLRNGSISESYLNSTLFTFTPWIVSKGEQKHCFKCIIFKVRVLLILSETLYRVFTVLLILSELFYREFTVLLILSESFYRVFTVNYCMRL